jgi:hypothetical protein
VNVSMIPSDLDPQVMRKLDGRAALAREKLDEAEASVSANGAAYLRAFDAWSAASDKLIAAEDKGRATLAQREKVRRLGAALDVAFDGAISSTRARLGAQRQVEELENPALVAQLARAEEEKRERLAALRAERERRSPTTRHLTAAPSRASSTSRRGTTRRSSTTATGWRRWTASPCAPSPASTARAWRATRRS